MEEIFYVSLKGSTFANEDGVNRQDLLKHCRAGDTLVLRPDPANPHDRHAVAVLDLSGRVLGWLPSDARDASDLARGRKVSAFVERIVGGQSLLDKLIGKTRNLGMVIRLEKEPIDWTRFNALRAIAEKVDKDVEKAIKYAKAAEDAEKVIQSLDKALKRVIALNRDDPEAAGLRYVPAPIGRLTAALVKAKRFDDALDAFALWKATSDPVGLPKSDTAALDARMKRVAVRIQ